MLFFAGIIGGPFPSTNEGSTGQGIALGFILSAFMGHYVAFATLTRFVPNRSDDLYIWLPPLIGLIFVAIAIFGVFSSKIVELNNNEPDVFSVSMGILLFLFFIIGIFDEKNILKDYLPYGAAWTILSLIILISIMTWDDKVKVFTLLISIPSAILASYIVPLIMKSIGNIKIDKKDDCNRFYSIINYIKYILFETRFLIFIVLGASYFLASYIPKDAIESENIFEGLAGNMFVGIMGLMVFTYSNMDGPGINPLFKL